MNEEIKQEQARSQSEENPNETTVRQNQLATILIGILVVIAGFLTYNYLQSRQASNIETGQVGEGATQEVATPTPKQSEFKGIYTVKPGDTLSSIAEEIYGSAQNWREIALANGISIERPLIKVGQELKLPAIGGPAEETKELAEAEPTAELTPESEAIPTTKPSPTIEEQVGEIAGEEITKTPATGVQTYAVERGDTLWEIAVHFYGDGTKWHKIYDANPLSIYSVDGREFPLIHAGNLLMIPE